jgi:broad specificity phosphatase PhoE
VSRPSSTRAPQPADLGPPTTLLLVRHGRTGYTESGRFSGGGHPGPGLSANGFADAAALAAALGAGRVAAGEPVDAVVCSPMVRTRQTAQVLADALRLPVGVDEGWAEAGFGEWDGLTYGRIAAGWPDLLARWQGSSEVAPPGGETLQQVAARVEATRRRLAEEQPGRTVVVVTHVTPIRVAVREALDAGWPALWRLQVSPCSVTVIRFWSDGNAEVAAVNARY